LALRSTRMAYPGRVMPKTNGSRPTRELSVDQGTRPVQRAPGEASRIATTRCGGYSGFVESPHFHFEPLGRVAHGRAAGRPRLGRLLREHPRFLSRHPKPWYRIVATTGQKE
jgi:hypothetical protein